MGTLGDWSVRDPTPFHSPDTPWSTRLLSDGGFPTDRDVGPKQGRGPGVLRFRSRKKVEDESLSVTDVFPVPVTCRPLSDRCYRFTTCRGVRRGTGTSPSRSTSSSSVESGPGPVDTSIEEVTITSHLNILVKKSSYDAQKTPGTGRPKHEACIIWYNCRKFHLCVH